MIKHLFLLISLLNITFIHATILLSPINNTQYTLNMNSIMYLHKIHNFTLTIDKQEIEYITQSYTISSTGSIHWVGYNKIYNSTFSFILLNQTIQGNILLNQRNYTVALIPHSSTIYQVTKDDKQRIQKVCQKKSYTAKNKQTIKKNTQSILIPSLTTSALEDSTEKDTQVSSEAPPTSKLEITTQINVLILYTQDFTDYYGTNTNLTIQHYFNIANNIYKNSQTNVHLNLVHTALTNNSTFTENNSITTALPNLQSNADIHALKRKYNADIVSLFRKYDGNSGTCGLGYLFNNIENTNYFYTVIEIKSSNEGSGAYCPDRTFAHEVGHNFGCAHDRDHTSVHPNNDYAYGYDIDGEFATVMSYDTFPIPYFSNPNLQYNDIAIGTTETESEPADNARNIREKRIYVKQKEILEPGDEVNENSITGILKNPSDKDSFKFHLKGEITFNITDNGSPHYLHIYDSDGNLQKSSTESFNYVIDTNSTYTILVSLKNADGTSYYQSTDSPYTIDIITENGSIDYIDYDSEARAFIERFYQNILGRSSDKEGLNNWFEIIKTHSATKVAKGFFYSKEFIDLNLDNNAFIDILYQTLFNREADVSGKNTWLDKLNSGVKKEFILSSFFNSQEFYNLTEKFHITAIRPIDQIIGVNGYINRFYTLVLARESDIDGFTYWANALVYKTRTGGDIAKGFFNSNEYIQRSLDDSTFIDICYRAFFNREADIEGKDSWLTLLDEGYSKNNILNGFISSQEFINLAQIYGILAED